MTPKSAKAVLPGREQDQNQIASSAADAWLRGRELQTGGGGAWQRGVPRAIVRRRTLLTGTLTWPGREFSPAGRPPCQQRQP
jgi:hypothetical protein